MSGYERKEGDIAVFFNDPSKKKNPNSPDWTGEALINGQKMRVALWTKTGTMLAGKMELAREQAAPSQGYSPTPPQPKDDLEDEIPF